MSTFREVHDQLMQARCRKAILVYLIEHIDENFIAPGGGQARLSILTDDKQRVPPEMFEAVVADTLNAELAALEEEVSRILSTQVEEKKEEPQAQEAVS